MSHCITFTYKAFVNDFNHYLDLLYSM